MNKTIERTLRTGKRVAVGLATLVTLSGVGCSTDVNVNNPDDINVDTKHIGSVQGVVAVPFAKEGKVVWEGISGAEVWIERTSFADRTTFGGWYSIDSLPDDNYAVMASISEYFPDTVGAVVEKQEKVTADTLRLLPKYDNKKILHGTVYDANGSPAQNKSIEVWGTNLSHFDDPCYYTWYYPGRKIETIQTSNDGSYAMQNLRDLVSTIYFKTGGKRLLLRDTGKDCIERGSEINKPINKIDLDIPN